MLVGQTGSGKSVCWKILQASMTRLKRDGDSSFNIVRVSLRNSQRIYTKDICDDQTVPNPSTYSFRIICYSGGWPVLIFSFCVLFYRSILLTQRLFLLVNCMASLISIQTSGQMEYYLVS